VRSASGTLPIVVPDAQEDYDDDDEETRIFDVPLGSGRLPR
jgi:hypothetical protein